MIDTRNIDVAPKPAEEVRTLVVGGGVLPEFLNRVINASGENEHGSAD